MNNVHQSVFYGLVFFVGVLLGAMFKEVKEVKNGLPPVEVLTRICYRASPDAIMKDPALADWYFTFCKVGYIK
jgi:hypothetical protein